LPEDRIGPLAALKKHANPNTMRGEHDGPTTEGNIGGGHDTIALSSAFPGAAESIISARELRRRDGKMGTPHNNT
jgi:hypothetical protein